MLGFPLFKLYEIIMSPPNRSGLKDLFAARSRQEDMMDDDLLNALNLLLARDDDGRLFDCEADEGGYRSQELEDALKTIRVALGKP